MIENYEEYVKDLVKQAEKNLWENYYLEEPKQKVNIREILENLGWTTIDDRNFHTPMVCAMSFYKPYFPSVCCASVCRRRKFSFCQVVHPSAHYTTLILFCQLHFRLLSVCLSSLFRPFFPLKRTQQQSFFHFYIKFLRIFA